MKTSRKWIVIKATGGCTFVEKGSKRFPFYFDESSCAYSLADFLNKLDSDIESLKKKINKLK